MLSFRINWSMLGCGLVDKGEFSSSSLASVFSLSVFPISLRIPVKSPSFQLLRQKLGAFYSEKKKSRFKHDVDLEIGGEVNCDGNVVLTTPELEDGQTAAANVVDDANGENSQLVQKHANPTSDRLLGNDVDGENGGKSQLDPEHAKQTYDISKLLKIYAVGQAGILAGTRRGGWKWIPLMLSGLVSTAAIVVVLQQKGYRTWDAKKTAVVVMLLSLSVCLLLSFIP